MSFAPLSVSVEQRERHPYRSLYAEMLFQSFRDALATAREETSVAVQELVEGPFPAGREDERTRQESKREQRVLNAHLPERGCAQ